MVPRISTYSKEFAYFGTENWNDCDASTCQLQVLVTHWGLISVCELTHLQPAYSPVFGSTHKLISTLLSTNIIIFLNSILHNHVCCGVIYFTKLSNTQAHCTYCLFHSRCHHTDFCNGNVDRICLYCNCISQHYMYLHEDTGLVSKHTALSTKHRSKNTCIILLTQYIYFSLN